MSSIQSTVIFPNTLRWDITGTDNVATRKEAPGNTLSILADRFPRSFDSVFSSLMDGRRYTPGSFLSHKNLKNKMRIMVYWSLYLRSSTMSANRFGSSGLKNPSLSWSRISFSSWFPS